MGLDITEVRNMVTTRMILGGKDKTDAANMAKHAVRQALKRIWREHLWSFSTKISDLTLTADNTTGYVVPGDCEAVVSVIRQSTDDYGHRLSGIGSQEFDQSFPYPAAFSASSSMVYKIEFDQSTTRPLIFVYPKNDASDAAKLVYKLMFTEEDCCRVIPNDFEPLVSVGADYYAQPAVSAEQVQIRGQLFQEFKTTLNDYKKKDRIMLDALIARYGLPSNIFSKDSWQWILDAS
jgi:hypothetical protein